MAKYALVHIRETRVQAVANTPEERFDVHTDLLWHECPDDVEHMWEYNWETGEFSPPVHPETRYDVARKVGFGDVGAQLGFIYDALKEGGDPTSALTEWAQRIENVKILFPKNNHEAMIAANKELSRRVELMLNANEADPDNNPITPPDVMTQTLALDYIEGRWDNPVTGPYQP